jgi:PST family polysaccharide transporter
MSEKKTLVVNFSSLSVVQIASYAIPFIYIPYLVRIIGPDKFGAIAFAQAVVAYFSLITDLGTNLYAPREIAMFRENRYKVSKLVSNILSTKILFLLIAIFIYMLTIFVVPKFTSEKVLFIFTGGSLITTALSPVWFFQGIEKMINIAAANLLSRILGVILIFMVIHKVSDYVYVPLLNVLAQTLGILFMYYVMFAKEKIKIIKPNIASIIKILKESMPLFISNVSIRVYTGINTVILGFLTNNTVVGYYSAAEKLAKAVLSVQSQLGVVFYPHISKVLTLSKEKAINVIKKAFVVTMLFAIPATVFVLFSAKGIIYLIYGNKFYGSILPLKILSFLFIIIGLSNIFGIEILLPFGKRKEFMKPIVTAGIINLMLNFILVPLLKQNGAVLSFLVSEIWVTFWMYLEIKALKIIKFKSSIILKLSVLALCLTVLLSISNHFIHMNLDVYTILSAVIYVFVSLFFVIILKLVDIKKKAVVI